MNASYMIETKNAAGASTFSTERAPIESLCHPVICFPSMRTSNAAGPLALKYLIGARVEPRTSRVSSDSRPVANM